MLAFGCSGAGGDGGAGMGGGAAAGGGVVLEVSVGPEREPCVGVAPQSCLVVDGELFYQEIDGFDHQPGYRYRISMEQYELWPEGEEVPQDASLYGYRLVEVIEKVRAR